MNKLYRLTATYTPPKKMNEITKYLQEQTHQDIHFTGNVEAPAAAE
jgi:hypothetical protein